MQENQNFPTTSYEGFGMTEQDLKNNKIKNFLLTIKYFFQKIEPTLIKVFSIALYYSIKFIKSFVGSAFQMIKGGGS